VSNFSDVEQALAASSRCVVVVGASIPGLLAASRLANDPAFDGEVILVTGGPPVEKRLINGCTLRWGAVQRMASALGTPVDELWLALGGPVGSFSNMWVGRAVAGDDGYTWDREAKAGLDHWIGLSTRHGHILKCLRERLPNNVKVVEASVPTAGAYRSGVIPLTFGDTPFDLKLPADHVIVNATPWFGLLRADAAAPAPQRFVVAVQRPMHCAEPVRGENVAMVPFFQGRRGRQLGFYTPFSDPHNPQANWYGINTMVVSAKDLDSDGHLADVAYGLDEVSRALKMTPVDAFDTTGRAVIPIVGEPGVASQARLGATLPIVDLHRTVSPGAPAVNTDGMLAGAVGADVFAATLAASGGPLAPAAHDALTKSDAALREIRFWNKNNTWSYLTGPAWVPAAMTWFSWALMGPGVKRWTTLGAKS
jgi:hypothetical protein